MKSKLALFMLRFSRVDYFHKFWNIFFVLDKYYTNFDNGFGVWSNVQGRYDPLDWQRGRGKTSQYSGPQSDHTDGNGKQVFTLYRITLIKSNIYNTISRS